MLESSVMKRASDRHITKCVFEKRGVGVGAGSCSFIKIGTSKLTAKSAIQ